MYSILTFGLWSLDLSEQVLVDCDSTQNGCGGGWPYRLLQAPSGYAVKYGVTLEQLNPYKGTKQTICSNPFPWLRNGNINPYNEYNGGDEAKLLEMVQRGPVVIALYASSKFMNYIEGIFEDIACEGKVVNHAGESLKQWSTN
jgi:hypothetical protein